MNGKIVALLLLTLPVPMTAAQTAVLIGLRHDSYSSDDGKWNPASYSTLLLTLRDGEAQVAANVPALIVPRKDGFWRLGVLHSGTDSDFEEKEYAIPAGSPVPAPTGSASTGSQPGDSGTTCSTSSESTIEFASSEIISVKHEDNSDCGVHPAGSIAYATYKIDDLSKPLEIAAVLGRAASGAQIKSVPAPYSDECEILGRPDAKGWGIQWSPGQWVVMSTYSMSHACGGDQAYELNLAAPASLVGSGFGRKALSPPSGSATAKKLVSEQYDLVLAPGRDFLIFFGNPITVFGVNGQELSAAPVLSAASEVRNSTPVMVQWALGKHVTEWESALREIAAKAARERDARDRR
jgi:hypothetical protein